MKIAGRKNDGAWFRTNKAIQRLTETERANLAGSIDNSAFIDAAFNDLLALQAEAGITGLDRAANTLEWAQALTNEGIPHQVWFGLLSWTSYTKETSVLGKVTYRPNYQSSLRNFARDLRAICKRYFLTRRQIRDVFNSGSAAEGNPSGLPDTNPVT